MKFHYKMPSPIGFQLAPMLDLVFLLQMCIRDRYSPATVSYIVHFRAESGAFPPEHSLCPYSQQAGQQDHMFSRMGKGRGLVFLRGRRYFRQLPHGKFTPCVARVSGSEADFPAMLFQYVKDGEGISPVIPFAYIGLSLIHI